ncbi:hypothetical protein LY90DRAFT_703412 [Neocallimastix californiae]|uniref:LITAF domain-containing protein n=1 Tax=Neocallimastix californiae TaxID=1754190 RepID=A0A1Y2CGZ5_9FUNG|nr:hypothetical protein LY90DRAFT_703412 [Neocallimastix californiae]|eukprot:ORY46282.1 hypothetical protein LY90DRAFT_703412 [Neocallimastix californiae]
MSDLNNIDYIPIVNNNVPLNPQESFMNNNVPINSQVPIIQQNSNVQVAPQASIVQPGFQPVYFNSNPPTYEQSIDNNVILNSTSFTTTTPTSEFSQNQSKVNTSTRNQEVVLMINETQVPRSSFKMRCPHCNKTVDTEVQFEDNVLVWALCIILFIFTCLCCIPFCISDLKDAVHYCPICRNEIARRDRVI